MFELHPCLTNESSTKAGGISNGRDEGEVRFDVDESNTITTPSFDEDALRRRTVKQLAAQLHGWLDGKIQHQKRGSWRLVFFLNIVTIYRLIIKHIIN